jgi:glycosyltransferase involved in cell wall biosynthesis
MASQLLSIVIPTRDRAELLELSLRSVFEQQDRVPNVIVSDNSTSDIPALQSLQKRYKFSYVRQSGKLNMTEHHNICLQLAPTPWILLLHDDDELYPNILGKLESWLAKCGTAGVAVGGIQYINRDGTARGTWLPDFDGTFSGEEIVLRLGLDYRVCPPGTLWNVSECRELGGFPSANGVANEQGLLLRLAFSPGVAVFPEIIGRYRVWSDQTTNFSTPKQAEYIVDCTIAESLAARNIGVSPAAADQLMDYMIWWVFRFAIPLFSKHPFFVSKLCRKCELSSPRNGQWRNRVKNEHPYLFWKPRRLSILLFVTAMRLFPLRVRQAIKVLPKYFARMIRNVAGV